MQRFQLKNNNRIVFTVIGFILVLSYQVGFGPVTTYSQDLNDSVMSSSNTISDATTDHIQQVSPGVFQIGGIRLDGKTKEIRFPAKVNMTEGLIEVIICTEYGKRHESVFYTEIRPMDLHTALLLLGQKPGTNPGWHLPMNPDHRPSGWDQPTGDRVDVFAAWKTDNGTVHNKRAGEFVINNITKRTLRHTNWIFSGSSINTQGIYMADEVGSILTNYHDRTSVLDNPLESGQVDDYIFANTNVIPPVGTAVEIRIIPIKNGKD